MKRTLLVFFLFIYIFTLKAQYSSVTPFNIYGGLLLGGSNTQVRVDYSTPSIPNFYTQDVSEKHYAITYRGPVLKLNLYKQKLYLGGYFGVSVGGTFSKWSRTAHNTGYYYIDNGNGTNFNAYADVLTGLQLGYKMDQSQTSFGGRFFLWDNRNAAQYSFFEQDNVKSIGGFYNHKKLGVDIFKTLGHSGKSGFSHTQVEVRYKFGSKDLGMILGIRYNKSYLNKPYQVSNYYGWGTISGPGNEVSIFFGYGR